MHPTEDAGASPPLSEADSLLERLRCCSLEALDAARAGDLHGVERLVDERDRLMSRLGPLLARVRARVAAPAGAEPVSPAAREALLRTLEGVRAADLHLARELERQGAALGGELHRLQRGARAAYPAAAAPGRHLDVRR